MIEAADDFTDLSPRAAATIGLAALFAAVGTLTGLAGLLMWGIRAFDLFAPGPGDAAMFVEALTPYFTVLNFVLTLIITVCGCMNLSLALRWNDFFSGEWRRYLLLSGVSVAAAVLFLWVPNVV